MILIYPGQLLSCGLTGEPLDDTGHNFQAGPRFMQMLSFVGCSPNINIRPGAEPFCYIQLLGGSDARAIFPAHRTPTSLVIVIWNIFDGEAVPSDPLLDNLQATTACNWRYFYCTSEASPITGKME
jgi:hypothetical protein